MFRSDRSQRGLSGGVRCRCSLLRAWQRRSPAQWRGRSSPGSAARDAMTFVCLKGRCSSRTEAKSLRCRPTARR